MVRYFLYLLISAVWAFPAFAVQEANTDIVASVLPSSRTAQVGGAPVTFFATIINAGTNTALNCRVELASDIPAVFEFAALAENGSELAAPVNQPIDIAPGANQNFVIGFSFSSPMAVEQIELRYRCDNSEAFHVPGVTTVELTAAAEQTADILSLATTINGLGYTQDSRELVFAAAVMNLNGVADLDVPIAVYADTNDRLWTLNLLVCELDENANCIGDRTDRLTTTLNGSESRSFAVWIWPGFSSLLSNFDTTRIRLNIVQADTGQRLSSTTVGHLSYSDFSDQHIRLPALPMIGAYYRRYVLNDSESLSAGYRAEFGDLIYFGTSGGDMMLATADGSNWAWRGEFDRYADEEYSVDRDEPPFRPLTLRSVGLTPGEPSDAPEWTGSMLFQRSGHMRARGAFYLEPDSTRLLDTILLETNRNNSLAAFSRGRNWLVPEIAGAYHARVRQREVVSTENDWLFENGSAQGMLTFDVFENSSRTSVTCEAIMNYDNMSGISTPLVGEDRQPNLYEATLQFEGCSPVSPTWLAGGLRGSFTTRPLVNFGLPQNIGIEGMFIPISEDSPDFILWVGFRSSHQ